MAAIDPAPAAALAPRRVVVFSPNLIGDAVMATPAIRALRASWPDARLTLVARPNVAPVFDGSPWFANRILYAPRAKARGHRGLAAVRALRAEKAELGILFPNSFRSALLLWLGGVQRRLGYDRGGRGLLLTDSLTPQRHPNGGFFPVPAVEYYLALVRSLGIRPGTPRTLLFTTREEEQRADDAWDRLGLSPARPVVCLNTGGAFGPAKNWPVPHFVRLSQELVSRTDCQVLILCGPAEKEVAREIAARADHPRVLSLADQPLSIGLSKAAVRRCSLLITTDSGPRHFAGAFGTPVITLFGPTHIGWTRTYHPQATHLQHAVDCGPCQQPVCPLGHHRCMVELAPERVLEQALRWLERPAGVPVQAS